MPAKFAQRKGGAAAEIERHVEAVTHRQITPAAGLRTAQLQRLPGTHGDRLPERHRLLIQPGAAVSAGQGDQRLAVKAQRWPLQGKLQARRLNGVADDAVSQSKGEIIHRAGRRHADIPVAGAARIILDAAPGAGLQHFHHWRAGHKTIKQARGGIALLKGVVGDHLTQIVEVGGNAV